MGSLWHGYAAMAEVESTRMVIDRGEGAAVFDDGGNRYLDASGALWFCNIGYGRTEMADAIAQQVARLHTFHAFGRFANQPALDLAEQVADIAPFDGGKVFFTSGGSDSVETAAKLVRRYFAEIGQPERTVLIARTGAYHGMHGFGTSLVGIPEFSTGYGPLMPDIVRVEWDSAEAVEKTIEQVGPERIAGFLAEPVIGAGGVHFPPPGYFDAVTNLVHNAGGLLIVDEVITGFGRMGEWFGSIRLGLRPDIITFAKGITSGYMPLGGVIAATHVAEPFWDEERHVAWMHGYTYTAHASAAAAGLKNMEIIRREGILDGGRRVEAALHAALAPLRDHPAVGNVRLGAGALAAVGIHPDILEGRPAANAEVSNAAMGAGSIIRPLYGGALVFSPPLISTDAEIGEMVAALRTGLDVLG